MSPVVQGQFASWLTGVVGLSANSLLPSVRCGLEAAVLMALAAAQDISVAGLLLSGTCHM